MSQSALLDEDQAGGTQPRSAEESSEAFTRPSTDQDQLQKQDGGPKDPPPS